MSLQSLIRSAKPFALSLLATALVAAPAKLGPNVQSTLASLSPTDKITLVVTFQGNTLGEAQLNAVRSLGISQGVTFSELPIMGVMATPSQAQALAQLNGVRSIWLNDKVTLLNADATRLTGVQKVRTDSTMITRNNGLPVSGRGIGVLINDSGVDGTHPDLKFGTHLVQNTLGSTNLNNWDAILPVTYLEGVPNTDTNSGHGTHVAGSVGGDGTASNGKFAGVAPGANLLGYGSGAALFVLDTLGGFNYGLVKQFQYNIRVITNSWGSSGEFDPENPVNVASKAAFDRGIVVTFAAGNAGPGEDTHNPYAKAPWVISVAAGTKDGKLVDFSSRGTKGKGGTFSTPDDRVWTWADEPTITAPGVGIISTRTIAPVSSLGATDDTGLAPGEIPYYTHMSGTSMATPHLAGIVALMLEANPRLSPSDVKQILQQTATNIPGREAWEVGAGYVNAYAAVDRAYNASASYGQTVNQFRTFNANASLAITSSAFTIDYNPATSSSNRYSFPVAAGLTEMVVKADSDALGLGQTPSGINLVLIAPDGTEYSSGIDLLFAIDGGRTVSVASPVAGTWTAEIRGLRENSANPTNGVALPATVNGSIRFKKVGVITGLGDISGHPAEAAIKVCIGERLMDGYSNGTFKPDQQLSRAEMANYLTMGSAVRQSLPLNGGSTFSDVSAITRPFAEAVAARGASLRDLSYLQQGVMRTSGSTFNPNGSVNRLDIAYSLVQSLGLESNAKAGAGASLTVQYGSQRLAIDDTADVPSDLRGYAQLALDLNILNATFYLTQGPFDLQPTIHAKLEPGKKITRGAYAVFASRFLSAFGQ
ncbi:MAG: S8 family serine peptidase [Acidobacteriota bacterium]|nr:S8 family serine peptidase [Acidobacteriota bacterium]